MNANVIINAKVHTYVQVYACAHRSGGVLITESAEERLILGDLIRARIITEGIHTISVSTPNRGFVMYPLCIGVCTQLTVIVCDKLSQGSVLVCSTTSLLCPLCLSLSARLSRDRRP